MDFIPASSSSQTFFLLIIVLVMAAFFYGVQIATRKQFRKNFEFTLRVVIWTVIWVMATSIFATNGFLESHSDVCLPLYFLAVLVVGTAVGTSKIGKYLALGLSLQMLVGFQFFRFPLELVLHVWANEQTIPTTMTWSGANFDVLTGLVAVATIPFIKHFRKAAWVPNVVGILLLINVLRVAVFSSPGPFAWNVYPPLQVAFHYPYTMILSVCIPAALAGHIVLTRALLRKPAV